MTHQDFSHGKFGSPSLRKASCDSHTTQSTEHAGSVNISTAHHTLTWTTGSSTCICDLFAHVHTLGVGVGVGDSDYSRYMDLCLTSYNRHLLECTYNIPSVFPLPTSSCSGQQRRQRQCWGLEIHAATSTAQSSRTVPWPPEAGVVVVALTNQKKVNSHRSWFYVSIIHQDADATPRVKTALWFSFSLYVQVITAISTMIEITEIKLT